MSDAGSLSGLACAAGLVCSAGYRAGRRWPLTLLPVAASAAAVYVHVQGAEGSLAAAECSNDYPFGALIVVGGI